MSSLKYDLIENYVYLYHIKKYIVIPVFPESMSDTLSVNFNKSTPMSRSAPIYSYSDSGPRSIQFKIRMHRDMMQEMNYNVSNYPVAIGEDYVDVIIKELQAAALPEYNTASKLVDPPQIAVRFGKDIFIKGVVTGSVTVDYNLPILENDKFGVVDVAFTVEEIQPFQASDVIEYGSYRGVDTTLDRNMWARG